MPLGHHTLISHAYFRVCLHFAAENFKTNPIRLDIISLFHT